MTFLMCHEKSRKTSGNHFLGFDHICLKNHGKDLPDLMILLPKKITILLGNLLPNFDGSLQHFNSTFSWRNLKSFGIFISEQDESVIFVLKHQV